MIEIGILLLVFSLYTLFIKNVNMSYKFFRIGFLTIAAIILIGGNLLFFKSKTITRTYISTEILNSKPKVMFLNPVVILELKINRPFTFIGDSTQYVINSIGDETSGKKRRMNI